MNIAIAIFVKTPNLTPLKTRLAASISTQKAHEFYHLSLKAIENTIQDTDLKPYWAVGEREALNHKLWSAFKTIHTGDGDLGDRQHHIYNTLLKTYDGVLLIGADAPQLSADILSQAKDALITNEFVIGPAHDGGYYLMGGTKPVLKDIWKQVPWSDAQTREKLCALLPSPYASLSALSDVDVEQDLQIILNEMPLAPNENQKALINWIKNL